VDVPGSDAALLNAIRSGDPGAYDVLRARHGAAARRLARYLPRGGAAADDVVDWSFTQVLDAIRRGGGPTDAFRPYLLTATTRAARDCAAGEATPVPADDQDLPAPGQLPGGHSRDPVVAAFVSLPERWRAVLWHTEVEGSAPAAVAPLFGLSPEGAAALAASAREGLAASLDVGDPDDHESGLPDMGGALRTSVAPLVLGAGTAAYLADAASGAIGESEGTAAGNGAAYMGAAGIGAAGSSLAGNGTAGNGTAGNGTADHDSAGHGAAVRGAGGLAAIGLAAGAAEAARGLSAAPPDGAPVRTGRPARPGAPPRPGRVPRLRVTPRPGTGTRSAGPGGPGRGSAPPRPSAVGTAAMSEMTAAAAAVPEPDPPARRGAPRRRGSGYAAKAGPYAARASAAAIGAAALVGSKSRLALHHWRDDTGRQKEITAVSAAVLLALGVVGYGVLLRSGAPQSASSPAPAVAAPAATGPTASAAAPPAPSPSSHAPAKAKPAPAVPVAAVANNPPPPPPPPPAAVRLAAMINVQGPTGFNRLAQVQFTVTDTGSRGTAADLRAAITLPRGVLPLIGSGRLNGWSCSIASPGEVCVHGALPAGASTSDVFAALVAVMPGCRGSVRLTVTSGAAEAFASAPIPCGAGPGLAQPGIAPPGPIGPSQGAMRALP
jgi:DNA-directed RNA polymerase specialized sigma24 family protein